MPHVPAHADLILQAPWIAPIEGPDRLLKDHAIVIAGTRIVDILPITEAGRRYKGGEIMRLDGHLLMPGFVNAHTHMAMHLFRGLADDLPLMTWLQEHIWPAESRVVSEQFVLDGSRLAAAEMIRSGTTTFADMYFFPDATAKVAAEAGLRANLFCPVLDFPSAMCSGPEDYLRAATQLAAKWEHEPLISVGIGPHAPYTVSDTPLARIAALAEELNLPVMIHLHETAAEVDSSLDTVGARPLDRIDRLNLLTKRLMAVHMTQLTDDEIARLAETGTHVIHCPESNLKLASGFCPVDQLLAAGVNVALGTDGAASNNDADMIGEMRTAALIAKGFTGRADALPADTVLAMATLNGARALGQGDRIGSLLPGKQADIIAIDLNRIETQPVYDPIAQVVYAAGRDQVTHMWVAGRCLMADRELLTLNASGILRDVAQWQETIRD